MNKSRFVGTVKVDFAGTLQEAEEFAREHASSFPRGLTVPSNLRMELRGELPMLCAPFKSSSELRDVSAKFRLLGWGRDSQMWPERLREVEA